MKAFLHTALSTRRMAVLLGVVAGCVLLGVYGAWLFGPLMAPLLRRVLGICAIILLWLGIEGVLFWRHHRANAHVLDGLQEASQESSATTGAHGDIHQELADAFDFLRSERIGRGIASDFAYALPWYLLIGPEDAGKSALVKHSTLRMPMEERLGRRAIPAQLHGHTVRWWFTDEALLISVPTVAATQPGDAGGALRAAEDPWRRVLSFLTRYRPRRPLDGALVVVPADALLDGQGAQLANSLRLRLMDAMRTLAARVQVYVVVTKCDRITGLPDFCATLDTEARAQALGAALPVNSGKAAQPAELQLQDLLRANLGTLTRLLQFHIAAERDVSRRARMLSLPEQLAQLTDATVSFVAQLSTAGRFDKQVLVRGAFFTAAEPASSDEFVSADAWDASFARPLGLRVAAGGRREAGRGQDTQSLFVTGLFRDVVFPQAGLAGRNPRAERRTAAVHLAGYALCLFGLIGTAALWMEEFGSHQVTLSRYRAAVAREQTLTQESDPRAGIGGVLPLLDQAHLVAELHHSDTSIERNLGLSPMDVDLAREAAAQGYQNVLRGMLLPAMVYQLQQSIQTAMATGARPETLRPMLATYLMLGEPQHFDRATVTAWANDMVASSFQLDPLRRDAAMAHLRALLPLLPATVLLDQDVILQARSMLHQSRDADLIYARLKDQAQRGGIAPPLDVVSALGAAGSQLLMLRSQAGLPVVVPGLYTRNGFYQIYLKQIPELVHNASANDWVMGQDTGANAAQDSALLQQVTALYVRDYIKQWQSVLSQMALRALPDLSSLQGGLQTLSAPDSPLIQFVQMVKTQTDLAAPPQQQTLLGRAAGMAGSVGGAAAGQAAQAAATQIGAQGGNPLGLAEWPGDNIRTAFAPLLALVNAGPGGGQAPVLRVQDTLMAAYGVVSGVASAQDANLAAQQVTAKVISGQGADPLIGLRVQAVTLPRPIDGIFRALYQNIWGTLLDMTRDRIQANWARDVTPACEQSIARRYPFVEAGDGATSVDVTLQDFSNFFGRGGVMNNFVASNLTAFTSPGPNGELTLSTDSGLSLGLSAQTLDQINRARRFRDLFFGPSGNVQMQFTLTPAYLDPRALSAVLTLDQTQVNYRHQPPRPTTLNWPAVNASGMASLVVTGVGGETQELQASGPWAIFRLLAQAKRSAPGGNDQLRYTFTLDGIQAAFGLHASSVTNPFASNDFTRFRCVPRL